MADKLSLSSKMNRAQRFRLGVHNFLSGYFWIVFKNVIGWILILSALPVGLTLPGPGGLPLFLLGFALVTFPGKRQLTSRVMRGRGLPLEMQVFTFLTAFFSIVATVILMWFVSDHTFRLLQKLHLENDQRQATYTAIFAGLVLTGLYALGVTWVMMRLSLKVLNYILRGTPFIRRKMRPWLRKRGLILLPSRRKNVAGETGQGAMNDEIIELSQANQQRVRSFGQAMLLWAKRALGVGITMAIFFWIGRPIVQRWPQVREHMLAMSPMSLITASAMFAIFLFTFRVLIWRRILAAFGHEIPIAPATRIWSTSELARYLPGAIWQVVGRVYLVRPYGVTGTVCSITQVLELAIFLLANLLVAIICLGYYGFKHLEGKAQLWLYVSAVLVPILLCLLHTKIFYGITNAVLKRIGKPQIVQRVRGKSLPGMLAWNVIGLIWQALALFVLMQQPLGLEIDWLWTLAGAYCLAWCAGFLAFWAPGGLGVRELVFIGAMRLIAPITLKNEPDFEALLAFLSVLTRVWATGGELILASIAYALDYRGAMGMPDAPGRLPPTTTSVPVKTDAAA